jgi:two-component system, OmpR family, sensor histidine kinase CreC
MKLGLRLLFGFFLITGLAAFFVLRVFVAEIKPSVREVMEDLPVDTANILAELAAADLAAMPSGGTLQGSGFSRAVQAYAQRPIDAKIWGLSKRTLDYRVYVTDASGWVVFDSGFREGQGAEGEDYSRWNDVSRTLAGRYGARATREVQHDDSTSSMYVAAPVKQGDRIIGVLTVAKPVRTVEPFVERAQREILVKGAWLMGLSLAVGIAVTFWVVSSVRRLRDYAQRVQLGEPPAAPALSGELGDLAQAIETMQQRLQGREHVEQVVRALTHELKNPLAAIGGAAELLADDLPAADRQAFAGQIGDQTKRMQALVERMLELSTLEHRRVLDAPQTVSLAQAVQAAIDTAAGRADGVGERVRQRRGRHDQHSRPRRGRAALCAGAARRALLLHTAAGGRLNRSAAQRLRPGPGNRAAGDGAAPGTGEFRSGRAGAARDAALPRRLRTVETLHQQNQ